MAWVLLTLPLCLGVRPGRSPCTCAPPPLAAHTTLRSILASGIPKVWLKNTSIRASGDRRVEFHAGGVALADSTLAPRQCPGRCCAR